MLKLASDADVHGAVARALADDSGTDFVRSRDALPEGALDAQVLAWAAAEDRILLSNDRSTMIERPAKYGSGRVVHNQRHTEFATDLCHFRDREYRELRVGQRLGVIAARALIRCASEVLGIGRVNEATFDTHRL